MNKILQAILLGGEAIAVKTIPGAAEVDAAARGIIAAAGTPDKADDFEAYFKTGVATIQLLENLGVQFADEPGFQAGLYQAKAGFTQMAAAVKAHKAATA